MHCSPISRLTKIMCWNDILINRTKTFKINEEYLTRKSLKAPISRCFTKYYIELVVIIFRHTMMHNSCICKLKTFRNIESAILNFIWIASFYPNAESITFISYKLFEPKSTNDELQVLCQLPNAECLNLIQMHIKIPMYSIWIKSICSFYDRGNWIVEIENDFSIYFCLF